MTQNEKLYKKYSDEEWWKYTSRNDWIAGGLLYFNKEDKQLFIWERRYGVGWTINLGHRYGVLALLMILIGTILLMSLLTHFNLPAPVSGYPSGR